MTFMRMLCLALAVAAVSSCGLFRGDRDGETVEIRGEGSEPGVEEVRRVRIRASLSRANDRRNFTVNVTPFAAVSEQALESARHKATVYCLKTYGGSDIHWKHGPDSPTEELTVENDSVTLAGRCTQR